MDFPVSISVVMATCNTDIPLLKESVESILNQTFRDFEFLIIDDGSTNGSDLYLKSLQDRRVRIIWNPQNMGLTKSLNLGLGQARGKYIARMDADDVSLPERFEKQYAYMEAHPDVIVCGSKTGTLTDGKVVLPKTAKEPEGMEDYRIRMLFTNPGPHHPTAMIRHEQLLAHHILYDEKLICCQDYGLWETASRYGRIVTLEEVLLYYRHHDKQISRTRREIQVKCDEMTQKKILTALLGEVSDEEVHLHYVHSCGYYPDAAMTPEAAQWYDRLLKANRTRRIYSQEKLEKYVILLKKKQIRNVFRPDMSMPEKMQLIFRYLPFASAVRMVLGLRRHRQEEWGRRAEGVTPYGFTAHGGPPLL